MYIKKKKSDFEFYFWFLNLLVQSMENKSLVNFLALAYSKFFVVIRSIFSLILLFDFKLVIG